MEANLYRHAEFLRRIARGLLREVHAADDVVHDAYAEVLARGGRFSRAYLAATVRHKALKWLRSKKRSRRREREAARSEAAAGGDPGDLTAQAELQRMVAEAVADLEPAQRDSIVLRYYHGLAPAGIARRTGEPVGTVKTRLRRALQVLRARLDQRHDGDTRAWALGLAFVLAGPAISAPTSGAGTGASLALKLAATAVVASAVTFVAWQQLQVADGPNDRMAVVPDEDGPGGNDPVVDRNPEVQAEAGQRDVPGAPRAMRWKILPGRHGLPATGTKLELLWDKPDRPSLTGASGRIQGGFVVIERLKEESGNAFAVTPAGTAAWIRWNRNSRRATHPAGWVNEVTFCPLRTVRVKVVERGGAPLANVPVRIKQNYTPRGNGCTDANGEIVFEGLFAQPPYGKTADFFLAPDEQVGTGWRWLGSVDLDRADGDIKAVVEPLESFTVQIAGGGESPLSHERPPFVRVYRGEAVGVALAPETGRIGFRARRIAEGHPLRVTIEFPDVGPVTLDIEGNEARCELPLPARIAGTVLAPADGEFQLKVQRNRDGHWRNHRNVHVRPPGKDESLRFEAAGLPPGEYRLADELSGRTVGPFRLRADEQRELPPLDLSRCVWVRGRVEPAPQPRVRATYVRLVFEDERGVEGPRQQFQAMVEGGRFKVRVPGDRPAMLALESPRLIAEPVRATDGVVIRAREGARAELRFVFPEGLAFEIGSVYPSAQWKLGARFMSRLIEIDKATGLATIEGLVPAEYDEVRLRLGTWPTTVLENVAIGPGVNDLGPVRVARGSRVHVRVLVPEGQGPPRLVVAAQSLDDARELRQVNPYPMDVVTLPGLGAGRWRLTAEVMPASRDRFGFEREIELDGTSDFSIELDLRR